MAKRSHVDNLATAIHTINETDEHYETTMQTHMTDNNFDSPLISRRAQESPTKQAKKDKASSDSSSDDDRPEKAKWTKRNNEIDELKKIFFEFLMKW